MQIHFLYDFYVCFLFSIAFLIILLFFSCFIINVANDAKYNIILSFFFLLYKCVIIIETVVFKIKKAK